VAGEVLNLVFRWPPGTGVHLSYGNLAHKLGTPFGGVGT
jgi:hypothetical protein